MSAQHDAATCFCQPGLFIRAFWQPREKLRHEDPVSVSSLLPVSLSLAHNFPQTLSPRLFLPFFLDHLDITSFRFREKCNRIN